MPVAVEAFGDWVGGNAVLPQWDVVGDGVLYGSYPLYECGTVGSKVHWAKAQ